MCIFSVQGVLKIGQCHEVGQKLKYMISIIVAAIPKNVFLYEVETFMSLLSRIHTYPYSKCMSYCGYVCIVLLMYMT